MVVCSAFKTMRIMSGSLMCSASVFETLTILINLLTSGVLVSCFNFLYCQAAQASATPQLRFWPYYLSWAHSITMPCTCVKNASCNQLKVVPEPEIPTHRGKEWQRGVDDIRTTKSMLTFLYHFYSYLLPWAVISIF